jgi:hypothetical protein
MAPRTSIKWVTMMEECLMLFAGYRVSVLVNRQLVCMILTRQAGRQYDNRNLPQVASVEGRKGIYF